MVERLATFCFDTKYRSLRFRSAFILYILILVLGSIPHARAAIGELASGAVLHSLAYATITFLLFTGFGGNRLGRAVRALAIVALMGALDEYVQHFFPYRTTALGDWITDCSASIFTVLVLSMLRRHDATAP
jgi:VanZ family protein